jgi:membrane-associated phospholipid phosphatase
MQTETIEMGGVCGNGDRSSLACALRAHWRFKILLSTAISVVFWTAYLLAQRFPLGVVRPAPSLALDAWIPFLPSTVYLYESLWLLQAVAPWLMRERRELAIYCRTLLVILIPAILVFVLWPTSSPRPESTESANALYRTLIRIDLDLNAFPSLHAAFALYSALGCRFVFRGLRCRIWVMSVIWVWTMGILAATLLTKQHTVPDMVAGAILGWVGHCVYVIGRKRGRNADVLT